MNNVLATSTSPLLHMGDDKINHWWIVKCMAMFRCLFSGDIVTLNPFMNFICQDLSLHKYEVSPQLKMLV